jgi:hypothetical protein
MKENLATKAELRITGWVFGLFRSSGILENRNRTFRKLDLFRSLGEGEGKTPTQLGPLERANLNHWTTPLRFTQLFNNFRPG